ncbi:EF-hand domain-containing protein [Synechococcus sp. RSCCF101]|uniref:EF-hand domain-containing protein n=1 Tax=Synechococcus sp. RSCCF101 TaxID=2511069 RepID=UPI00178606E4|nr:EF-hand domain-containing protein [Synechococcus sp. RSCCF101]
MALPALLTFALAAPPVLRADGLSGQAVQGVSSYRERLRQLFQRYDRNGDGRLDAGEVNGHPYLQRQLRRRRPARNHLVRSDLMPAQRTVLGERLRQRFREADRNGDGRLNRNEAGTIPWLLQRFRIADIDADAGITLREIWILQRALSPRPTPQGRRD